MTAIRVNWYKPKDKMPVALPGKRSEDVIFIKKFSGETDYGYLYGCKDGVIWFGSDPENFYDSDDILCWTPDVPEFPQDIWDEWAKSEER